MKTYPTCGVMTTGPDAHACNNRVDTPGEHCHLHGGPSKTAQRARPVLDQFASFCIERGWLIVANAVSLYIEERGKKR